MYIYVSRPLNKEDPFLSSFDGERNYLVINEGDGKASLVASIPIEEIKKEFKLDTDTIKHELVQQHNEIVKKLSKAIRETE